MARGQATGPDRATEGPPSGLEAARLGRADRRDALLDAAAGMVSAGEVDAVSMDSVADAAGVSRALVYKHFRNRRELLSALYDRESAQLHAQLSALVQQGEGLAGKLRALIGGALAAQAARGATFAALGQSGGPSGAHGRRQRRRDSGTLRYFTEVAVKELGVDRDVAEATLGVALSTIPSVLRQWRRHPTVEHADLLTDCFVAMTVGGLETMARDGRPAGRGGAPA